MRRYFKDLDLIDLSGLIFWGFLIVLAGLIFLAGMFMGTCI